MAAIEPRFFANLCQALGYEELAAHQTDDDRQGEIRRAFREAFATRDRDDWVAELGPADCCVAAVASIPEVVDDDHFVARGTFRSARHPEAGEFRQLCPSRRPGAGEQVRGRPTRRAMPSSSCRRSGFQGRRSNP